MAKANLYLGTTTATLQLLTPFGRSYKINNVEQARSGRTASGRLVKDIIATKKEFSLEYNLIDDSELQKYIDLYAESDELIFRDERDSGYTDYTVLMNPLDQERIIAAEDGLWGGVQIKLSEV